MQLIGMGNDIVSIPRIEAVFARHPKRFLARIFTEQEQAYAERYQDRRAYAGCLAKRFAAKEAFVKAIGAGISAGIAFREIEVVNTAKGAPELQVTGKALTFLHERIPPHTKPQCLLSLSDDYPYALATVLIAAIP